ncbi:MAG: hypothetical protein ACJAVK_002037 [Akkermansiaceae bacterium]
MYAWHIVSSLIMKTNDLCSEIVSNDKAFRDYVESQKAWTPSKTVSREQAIRQVSLSAKVKKPSVFKLSIKKAVGS